MSGYTQAEIDRIADLLKEELSASAIAERVSAERGTFLTRNAIIGIVHRNKTLKAIGFANSTAGRKGGRKQTLPAPAKPMQAEKPPAGAETKARPATRYPAPYQLPGRLFIGAIEEIDREGEAFRLKSPTIGRSLVARQAHFAAMRFVDCLFDRCRAPLSSDLDEKPGPDMLCCGFRVEFGKPYCRYHEARLTNREHNFMAVAA